MRNIFALFPACITLLALASGPAAAELGPCRPVSHHGLICGQGDGAARVIEKTVSPSKRLALAWRSTNYPPTKSAEDDDSLELLLIRLKDGAVLSRRKTDYWDTGDTHVNRLYETATWSPDSRWMINTTEERYNTSTVDLYAFGDADRPTGPFDLLKIMESAARAAQEARQGRQQLRIFGRLDPSADRQSRLRARLGDAVGAQIRRRAGLRHDPSSHAGRRPPRCEGAVHKGGAGEGLTPASSTSKATKTHATHIP
jgi:hypothetical protein